MRTEPSVHRLRTGTRPGESVGSVAVEVVAGLGHGRRMLESLVRIERTERLLVIHRLSRWMAVLLLSLRIRLARIAGPFIRILRSVGRLPVGVRMVSAIPVVDAHVVGRNGRSGRVDGLAGHRRIGLRRGIGLRRRGGRLARGSALAFLSWHLRPNQNFKMSNF